MNLLYSSDIIQNEFYQQFVQHITDKECLNRRKYILSTASQSSKYIECCNPINRLPCCYVTSGVSRRQFDDADKTRLQQAKHTVYFMIIMGYFFQFSIETCVMFTH